MRGLRPGVVRLAALLLAALVLAAPARAQPPLAFLTGHVTGPDGPVAAADLTLSRGGAVAARGLSDGDGRFGIEAPPGAYTLTVTRLGFADEVREVALALGAVTRIDIELRTEALVLEGLAVRAAAGRERLRFEELAGVSTRQVLAEELKLLPGIAEADPIRAISVLPGVVSTSDFSAAFHVRGGAADQNLILVDGTPIFNPFHLGGFFSVFNADLIARADLSSGGFQARHGGRVSSVLSIESDPGDGTLRLDGGVSLLAARVAVAGGIGDRDVRWRVSARRSYLDKLLAPVAEVPYYLQDFQGVAEVGLGPRDRLRITAYTGKDVVNLSRLDASDFPLRVDWAWGNDVAGLRWTRDLDQGRLSARASWTHFDTRLRFPDFSDTDFRSEISQRALALDAAFRPLPALEVGLGAEVEDLDHDNFAATGGTVFSESVDGGRRQGAYLQLVWGHAGRWLVETGARIDRWAADSTEPITEVAPRVAAKRFFGGGQWAVNASAGRYTQFLHSLRDEELPIGLDIWVASGQYIPHVVSDQLQIGIEAFPNDEWTFAVEGYWRGFDGVITFNPADDPNDPGDDVLVGDGVSWGADLFVRRSVGAVNGWLSASFLKAERTFPELYSGAQHRRGVTYPPIFDRRLDLDLVLRFPAPRGWDGGLRLNVGTGTPYTRPQASYAGYQPRSLKDGGRAGWIGRGDEAIGSYAVVLGERNAERYPLYHRVDLGFRREFEKSWGVLTPHIDLLNIYNRKNVLFYFHDYERFPPVRSGLSMFPFLPTVGVEVRF